ncbi:putative Aminopeptidase M1-A [Blattamonas nauphoetae]|uniref:Aminopeptidase n=1 Tax=Blattamonas nauphoetae TaxID=2049346 RepID=A0ABQ9XB06_9EUKA|nr:putative Aminopeptidase M1-A [Blattamonas nauphoetae]
MTQIRESITFDEILPIQYDLKIDVQSLADGSENPELVKGELDYHFDVNKATNCLILNGKDLTLNKVSLVKPSISNPIPTINHNKETMQTTFTFSEPLPISKDAVLHIEFHHTFSKDLLGHYDSTGHHLDGTPFRLCLTQFEPFYARASFPCVDQPDAKAIFNISILHPKDKIALSNMPVKSSTIVDDKSTLTVFQTTPKMSTYLVAWAVGDFEYISGSCYDGKFAVNVYTMPGQKQNASFALRTAVNAIEYLTKYTGIPIPLPKMDLLCVTDFSAGAMENWGLITFREVALLADEANSSTSAMKQIARTVTHELVHQWAGNLVTMTWWDELWLNEGFATFLADLVNNDLFPDWNLWDDFQIDSQAVAFAVDSKDSTHPIHVPIFRVQDTDDIFDTISYKKSSSVLLMLNEFIGGEAFRTGLGSYLTELEYANSTADDLWNGFTKGTGGKIDVKTVMQGWVKQAGHPLVIVKREGGKLHLSQKRFCRANLNNADVESLADDSLWQIPLRIGVKYSDKTEVSLQTHLMTTRTLTLDLSDSEKIEWVKVNFGQSGFYRVLYDAASLSQLQSTLAHNPHALPLSDRLGLQSDMFSIAQSSEGEIVSFPDFLSFVDTAFRAEEEVNVLNDLWANVGWIFRRIWEGEGQMDKTRMMELRAKYGKWTDSFFVPLATKLGVYPLPSDAASVFPLFSSDKSTNQKEINLRCFVVPFIVSAGHEQTITALHSIFDTVLLPHVSPLHSLNYNKTNSEVSRIQLGAPEPTAQQRKQSGRIDDDTKLCNALLTIPSNLRSIVFNTAARVSSSEGELSLKEVDRLVCLHAIAHSISPALLPADQRTALRAFIAVPHVAIAENRLLLCLSNNESIGVRRMELHLAAAALAGLSSIGFGTELWRLIVKDRGSIWDQLRPRLGGNLVSFVLNYSAANVVVSGTEERKNELRELTEQFLTERKDTLPPITSKKVREAIDTNTSFWEKQGKLVEEWILRQ